MVPIIPEAIPERAGGTPAMIRLLLGEKKRPQPRPISSIGGRMTAASLSGPISSIRR